MTKYFLDVIDDVLYFTDSFTLYTLYRLLFRPDEIQYPINHTDDVFYDNFDIITFNGQLHALKIDEKYHIVASVGFIDDYKYDYIKIQKNALKTL